MASLPVIGAWLLVVFAVCYETIRHETVSGVCGPSFPDLVKLLVVVAACLFPIWLNLKRERLFRSGIVLTQIILVLSSIALHFGSRKWTTGVFASAEEMLQVSGANTLLPFRDVVITKDGLTYWSWVHTGLPQSERKAMAVILQQKLETGFHDRFPSIKRVVVVAVD